MATDLIWTNIPKPPLTLVKESMVKESLVDSGLRRVNHTASIISLNLRRSLNESYSAAYH